MSASNDASASSASTSGTASGAAVKVFKPPSGNTAAPPPPPADDALKPTPAELQAAFKDHIQQRHGPDAPMMTKAMRERDEARRRAGRKVYSEVKIRIRFADRTQIETTLPVTATLGRVYEFVRSSVTPEAAKIQFTLFTSPPKTDYAETDRRSLKDLGFVPAAVLSIRWNSAALNSPSSSAPLRSDLASEATDLPPPKQFDETQAGPTSAASGSKAGAGGTGAKPVPKWMKGIIKKK